jgi:hypothetical protein
MHAILLLHVFPVFTGSHRQRKLLNASQQGDNGAATSQVPSSSAANSSKAQVVAAQTASAPGTHSTFPGHGVEQQEQGHAAAQAQSPSSTVKDRLQQGSEQRLATAPGASTGPLAAGQAENGSSAQPWKPMLGYMASGLAAQLAEVGMSRQIS